MKTISCFSSEKTDALCARIFDNAVQSAERKACMGFLDKQICKMNNIKKDSLSNTEMRKLRFAVFARYKRSI